MRLDKFKYLNKEQYQALTRQWKELNNTGQLGKEMYYNPYRDTIELYSKSTYRLHLFYLAITGKDMSPLINIKDSFNEKLHDEMSDLKNSVRHGNNAYLKQFFGDIIPDETYKQVYNDLVRLFDKHEVINAKYKWNRLSVVQ